MDPNSIGGIPFRPLLPLTITSIAAVQPGRGVTGRGVQANTVGATVIGIARLGADAANIPFTVDCKGVVPAEAGAPFAAGSALMVDASGRLIAAPALGITPGAVPVTALGSGMLALRGGLPPVHVAADALQAASYAGQRVMVLLR